LEEQFQSELSSIALLITVYVILTTDFSVENRGMRVNVNKTKLMISGEC